MGERESLIKFDLDWLEEGLPFEIDISELNNARRTFVGLRLIGESRGVGYGNLSQKLKGEEFLITGSQTGHLPELGREHFTVVYRTDPTQNKVYCRGPIKASSESLTHAAVYQADNSIQAVVHTHDPMLWKVIMTLLDLPKTKRNVEYGTPALAKEVLRLFRETDVRGKKIFAVGGHQDGIISFGQSVEEAVKIMQKYHNWWR